MTADQYSALRAALALRYRIERELGRGGMATVYLAEDLKHGRPVAIKVLRHEIAAILGSDRFLREIGFAAKLSHPNILPLHDSDEAAGFLYYVMPYIEGGTLQDRLDREPRLPVDEALDITRQVAGGLAHAHGLGVVHRDIKPANILLAGRHVFIADFGVARAIRQAVTSEGLTEPGLVVGTPDYMAPEQVVGASGVDGRADEYSLACVLYEMLLGRLPSHTEGKSGAVRRALRAVRDDVPATVESALARALASDVTDRFPTVTEFAAALPPGTSSGPRSAGGRERVLSRRAVAALIGVPVAAAALWWGLHAVGARGGTATEPLPDTSRYVVLPFEPLGGLASLHGEQLLQDALARWNGISEVDFSLVREALGRRNSTTLSTLDAAALARRLNAGRYIRADVSRIGDSIRVHAGLYDATSGMLLVDRTVKLPPSLVGAEARFAMLADQLLLRVSGPASEVGTGTRSLSARQAFVRGQVALEAWDLVSADSSFSLATQSDPHFAQANLWLALVRAWSGASPPRWSYAAEQAATGQSGLSPMEGTMADAIRAQARGDWEQACRLWQGLTQRSPGEFASWYGSGFCQSTDSVVVRDPASASGWRFRTSYSGALNAYQRAFQLRPSILASFRSGSFESLRQLLMANGHSLRKGRPLLPDTGVFDAQLAWQGDSVVLVPFRAAQVRNASPPALAKTNDAAIRHQRELFRDVATTWATSSPQSADAMAALAVALEMLGDPGTLDTLSRARTLARDDGERLRISGAEVWTMVRSSAPIGVAGLRSARALADSLVRRYSPAHALDPQLMASLAALTGRAALSAAFLRRAAISERWGRGIPGPLIESAPALLTFAALGGPIDSLQAAEQQVVAALDNGLDADTRQEARMEWLARSATLAFPAWRFHSLPGLRGQGDFLLDGQAAFAAGDTGAVRQMFTLLHRVLRDVRPADRTLDALFPEAALLAGLGNTQGAIDWLDPTLNALAQTEPEMFTEPALAGALVQAMVLRADLAAKVGDSRKARQWAEAVVLLWSGGDPFLQPVVQRMKHLAGIGGP